MKNYTVVRSLVLVHIVNFQRDFVVVGFISIKLIICSTSNVDGVKVHYMLYVMSYKQNALSLKYIYMVVLRNAWKVLKCGAGEGWRRSVGPIM